MKLNFKFILNLEPDSTERSICIKKKQKKSFITVRYETRLSFPRSKNEEATEKKRKTHLINVSTKKQRKFRNGLLLKPFKSTNTPKSTEKKFHNC